MISYGLLGKTLKHSFSQKYFSQKFLDLDISGSTQYINFELDSINALPSLLSSQPDLQGFNVTIPYKVEIIPYLAKLDELARQAGAVNTVVIEPNSGKLIGYNTDAIGFGMSLEKWLSVNELQKIKALVLGTGGASKAVGVALTKLNIPYMRVSRNAQPRQFTYDQLTQDPEILAGHHLVINTTPLGTYPNNHQFPNLPYKYLTSSHRLYDLVYNPPATTFMKKGTQMGALVKNGYEMLVLQAEAAWKIWNQARIL